MPPPPNDLLLHEWVAPASYDSFAKAMNFHGIIDQVPYVTTCVRWDGPSVKVSNDFGRYWYTHLPRTCRSASSDSSGLG